MPSHSAVSTGAAPERSLGWLILIPLGCLVLGQAMLALSGALPVLDGALGDTDAYMRLSRVLQLHDSGSWFDSRFPRINPPDGHVQHWTRPLDALLLAGAWLLQPFLGFERALHLWGVLISPLFLALTIAGLAWASAPILDRDARVFTCIALLLQPTVVSYASLGRPDHHSLLFLLFVLLLGLTFRLLGGRARRREAAAAGLVAALAIWVSPEALVFIAPGLAALACCWLFGDDGMAAGIQRYLSALALGLAAGLLIERGPAGLLAIENDRLSLLHVGLFGVLALMWPLVVVLARGFGSWLQARWEPGDACHEERRGRAADLRTATAARAGAAAIGCLATLAAMALLFPELRAGPLGYVDPLYARVRLQRIVEIQPLVSPRLLAKGDLSEAIGRAVGYVGIALPAIPFLVLLLVREGRATRRVWAYVALALGLFLGLAFYQIRWSSYAQLLLLLPYAALVGWLLRCVAGHVSTGAAPFCRAPLIAISLFWPLVLLACLVPAKKDVAGCPIAPIAPALAQTGGGERQTIMAFADYGPELLYRTGLSVLSIPNHRPQPGFAATYRVLTATDEAAARAELARFGVDWILLCPNPVERAIFAVDEAASPTLYQRLADGAPPPWLRRLPLENGLTGDARLFEVIRGGPTASALTPAAQVSLP
jgi:hypothetical protein